MREDMVKATWQGMTMPCVCCDRPVLVDPNSSHGMKSSVAVCRSCYLATPISVIRAIGKLRLSVASLNQRLLNLTNAQQELEQEFLKNERREARA